LFVGTLVTMASKPPPAAAGPSPMVGRTIAPRAAAVDENCVPLSMGKVMPTGPRPVTARARLFV
jgi:hypothetical protein